MYEFQANWIRQIYYMVWVSVNKALLMLVQAKPQTLKRRSVAQYQTVSIPALMNRFLQSTKCSFYTLVFSPFFIVCFLKNKRHNIPFSPSTSFSLFQLLTVSFYVVLQPININLISFFNSKIYLSAFIRPNFQQWGPKNFDEVDPLNDKQPNFTNSELQGKVFFLCTSFQWANPQKSVKSIAAANLVSKSQSTIAIFLMIFYNLIYQLMTSFFLVLILTFSLTLTHAEGSNNSTDTAATAQDLTTSQSWGYGILAGVGLSSIGFVAALLVVALRKLISQASFKTIANLLYALGCGALVGDAIIHILPDAFTTEQVNFRFVALIFISAIVTFICIERLFVKCGITHQHWGDDENHSHAEQHGHGHGHKHQNQHDERDCEVVIKVDNQIVQRSHQFKSPEKNQESMEENILAKNITKNKFSEIESFKDFEKNNSNVKSLEKKPKNQLAQTPDLSNTKSETKIEAQKKQDQGFLSSYKGKGSAGYLNLLSSFIHNFFDGFAIGAAFASKDKTQYIPTLVAVFVHQIPREMGDVGILLKNKFNNCQTICCNGVVNFTSLLGVLLGLGLGSISTATETYILSFVAGNFIYIGADIWRNLLKSKSAFGNFLEFLSFAIGVGCMYLVLLAQDQH